MMENENTNEVKKDIETKMNIGDYISFMLIGYTQDYPSTLFKETLIETLF